MKKEKNELFAKDRYEIMQELNNRELTKREKWTYGLLFGAVLIFAMVGESLIEWILNILF